MIHYQYIATASMLNSNRLLSFERDDALLFGVLVLVGAKVMEEVLHNVREMQTNIDKPVKLTC
jgi:hypothetical protein